MKWIFDSILIINFENIWRYLRKKTDFTFRCSHTKRDPRPFSTRTYKDASKTNTGIGIAITNSNNLFLSYRLLDYNSIYTAKYLALLRGIRVAIQLPNPIINICTDSLSALNDRMYTFHSSTRAIKIGM